MRVHAHAHLRDVVDIRVVLLFQILPQQLRLSATFNRNDFSIAHLTDDRLFQNADADVRDAGIGDDGAVCTALQRGNVRFNGRDGGKLSRFHHTIQGIPASAYG